jgi:tetratricopeptide (TPR) repeat protein
MSFIERGLLLLAGEFVFALATTDTALGADERDQSLPTLKFEVKWREHELAKAQADLARARGRLAVAEGKLPLAASEFQKVVKYYEGESKRFSDLFNVCPDPFALRCVRRDLQEARIELAFAQGKPRLAVHELEKVVRDQAAIVRVAEILRDRKLVDAAEIKPYQEELARLRSRLEAARAQVRAKTDKRLP